MEAPTLRDKIATAALQGLLSHRDTHDTFETFRDVADAAYHYADAMLVARVETEGFNHRDRDER